MCTRWKPVSLLPRVTVAPTTRAPAESVTIPRNEEVAVCALSGAYAMSKANRVRRHVECLIIDTLLKFFILDDGSSGNTELLCAIYRCLAGIPRPRSTASSGRRSNSDE